MFDLVAPRLPRTRKRTAQEEPKVTGQAEESRARKKKKASHPQLSLHPKRCLSRQPLSDDDAITASVASLSHHPSLPALQGAPQSGAESQPSIPAPSTSTLTAINPAQPATSASLRSQPVSQSRAPYMALLCVILYSPNGFLNIGLKRWSNLPSRGFAAASDSKDVKDSNAYPARRASKRRLAENIPPLLPPSLSSSSKSTKSSTHRIPNVSPSEQDSLASLFSFLQSKGPGHALTHDDLRPHIAALVAFRRWATEIWDVPPQLTETVIKGKGNGRMELKEHIWRVCCREWWEDNAIPEKFEHVKHRILAELLSDPPEVGRGLNSALLTIYRAVVGEYTTSGIDESGELRPRPAVPTRKVPRVKLLVPGREEGGEEDIMDDKLPEAGVAVAGSADIEDEEPEILSSRHRDEAEVEGPHVPQPLALSDAPPSTVPVFLSEEEPESGLNLQASEGRESPLTDIADLEAELQDLEYPPWDDEEIGEITLVQEDHRDLDSSNAFGMLQNEVEMVTLIEEPAGIESSKDLKLHGEEESPVTYVDEPGVIESPNASEVLGGEVEDVVMLTVETPDIEALKNADLLREEEVVESQLRLQVVTKREQMEQGVQVGPDECEELQRWQEEQLRKDEVHRTELLELSAKHSAFWKEAAAREDILRTDNAHLKTTLAYTRGVAKQAQAERSRLASRLNTVMKESNRQSALHEVEKLKLSSQVAALTQQAARKDVEHLAHTTLLERKMEEMERELKELRSQREGVNSLLHEAIAYIRKWGKDSGITVKTVHC